jgi:hypothetical protein
MITGILIVDNDDNLIFDPNEIMQDSASNHASLFFNMSDGAVILTASKVFTKEKIREMIGPDALVFEDIAVDQLVYNYPWKPIVVVGNTAVRKSWDSLTDLIVLHYKSLGLNPERTKFDCPCCFPSKKVVNLPYYTVTHYELEPSKINTPLS